MNWLMEMFSEFSDKVMGEQDAYENDRKSRPDEGTEFVPRSAPVSSKKRAADKYPDLDW
ncbi:hypothetical protein [Henriciella barbarensis]|uniref:hypothetical protein n=1 Tax=Henriciella barbarensis TaxID=86342 RepID=UPI0015FB3EEB|nr:hypothetical protein [Henriciella barbarensis]